MRGHDRGLTVGTVRATVQDEVAHHREIAVRVARVDALAVCCRFELVDAVFGVREYRWVLTQGAPADSPVPYQLQVNNRPVRCIGTGIILLGIPLHYWFQRRYTA